jgi:hypothetical protein
LAVVFQMDGQVGLCEESRVAVLREILGRLVARAAETQGQSTVCMLRRLCAQARPCQGGGHGGWMAGLSDKQTPKEMY